MTAENEKINFNKIFWLLMHNTYNFSVPSQGPPALECFPCCRAASSWELRRWYRSQRGEVCNTNHSRLLIPSEESTRPQSSWRCWISAKCGLDHWHQSIGAQAPGWKGSKQSTLKEYRLHQDDKKSFKESRISHKVGNQYVDVVDNLLPKFGRVESVSSIVNFSKHDVEIDWVETQDS